ncbi:hypothetical protein DFJ74DRAFT_655498 [Hyaloraphidium curvatum]|nr:hypothetical protein DFJ74DRAFT_655498 [Hyaloraphidium curvatum]
MLSDEDYLEDVSNAPDRPRDKLDFEDYSLTPYPQTDDVLDAAVSDEQRLTQAWINERCAPALLPFQRDVVENLREALELQENRLDSEQSRDVNADVVASLCQEEMERIKFVLRSYLRTRIHKIEAYCKFILGRPSELRKLSEEEKTYARRYQELLERHFHSTVLSDLPENLRQMDDNSQGMSMVSAPDLNAAVFLKVTQNLGTITDGRTRVEGMKQGGIYIMRYATVQVLLEREQVVLL